MYTGRKSFKNYNGGSLQMTDFQDSILHGATFKQRATQGSLCTNDSGTIASGQRTSKSR